MGDFGYIFNQLALDYQYNALGKGLIDSRNIIYFMSVIFLALWGTKLKISTLK
jgi:ABC-2 type transport system permease protein